MDDHDDLVVLPGEFDRPRRADADPPDPVTVRDVISVVLVRDVASPEPGVDVLLPDRAAGTALVGGTTVLPGGGTSPGDHEPLTTAGPGAAGWDRCTFLTGPGRAGTSRTTTPGGPR